MAGEDTLDLVKKDKAIMDAERGRHGLAYYLVNYPTYRNLFYHRIGKSAKLLRIILFPDSMFEIASRTSIDGGMNVLNHPYATIINAKKIGKNCVVHQCTTIGNKQDSRNDLVPIIGDNVTISAHSVIIGKIKIGNNVIIGAGSIVVKDVPDNVVVAGNPARIIKNL